MANLKNSQIDDTGYFQLPRGTTTNRPSSAINGMMRFNTTLNVAECYIDGSWITVAAAIGSQLNPATSASQIRTVNPAVQDGDYWYKPSSTIAAMKLYTSFSSASAGKGRVLVARGRESTTWWNNASQNVSDLTWDKINNNTPLAILSNDIVNLLIGGNWNVMTMMVNRMATQDSFIIQGVSSANFSWANFNTQTSSVNATISRYSSPWGGGSLLFTHTNKSNWTDTYLSSGSIYNDCNRMFTWTWDQHGGYQGWSSGGTCLPISGLESYAYQYASEAHRLQLASVYVEC